ncbi:hypothetical protein HFD88_006170 [Aspergillus terreus]|nr:hypothetical protein HFD88_006170 [Aspergillus terreus]
MLLSPEFSLDTYNVSLRTGFLPDDPPLRSLEDPYYWPWEELVRDLPSRIRNKTIRDSVEQMPVLSTSSLQNEPQWRRAYLLLAYLTHAYVLPPAIARPFLEVSSHLELPPCATYAALNLWNYAIPDENADLTDPEILSVTASLTGTKDEEWFLMLSVAIEAKGAQVIPLMFEAIHAISVDDSACVANLLHRFSECLQELRRLLERMYEQCRPPVFFHQLRPLLAGSKNMAKAGLPNGVFYDVGDGEGQWHQYSGGSNAQSSLIQTFDIFLGVEHTATGEVKPSAETQTGAKNGFMQEMRNYMPGPHRRFLEMLARIAYIRPYAMSHIVGSPVRDAYNTAVMSLGRFRDTHIQIVTRYIIMAAKTAPPKDVPVQVNLASASTEHVKHSKEDVTGGLHGTGGTDLIPFLKQTRDATKAAASYAE